MTLLCVSDDDYSFSSQMLHNVQFSIENRNMRCGMIVYKPAIKSINNKYLQVLMPSTVDTDPHRKTIIKRP